MGGIINAYLVKRIEKLEEENDALKRGAINNVPQIVVDFVKDFIIKKLYYDSEKNGVYFETYWGDRTFFDGKYIREAEFLKLFLPKGYEK